MQKIIIAPDKFKGSLTGMEFCAAIEKGIQKVVPAIDVIKLPLADGGDGTIEILNYYLDGKMVSLDVRNPVYNMVNASYLYSDEKKTAYIEMAEASGIRLLKASELNPRYTTTYGTGELIADALDKGVRHIILGIGGSATNDAGMGMARALGYRFLDKNGEELGGFGKDLTHLDFIDDSNIHPELKNVKFDVACDVDNPLFGPNGAAYIYSPQKGASEDMVKHLDKGLQNFNEVVIKQFDIDLQMIEGAGAAGGLGAGSVLFLNARLNSGIELIKNEAKFNEKVKDTDWIITGEGKLDEQTFSGKVIKGVLDTVSSQKLAVFCGINELNKDQLKQTDINFIKETSSYASNLEDSIKNAGKYLEMAAEEFAKEKLL